MSDLCRRLDAMLWEMLGKPAMDDPPEQCPRFVLANVPFLAQPIAEAAADRLGMLSFSAFKARHAGPGEAKPTKPTDDWLEAKLRQAPPHNERQAELFKNRAHDKYYETLIAYETRAKEAAVFRASYTQDLTGYLRFLSAKDPTLASFFFAKERVLAIPRHDRERHSLLTGAAGSGKSEALKLLVFDDVRNYPDIAVVILDPGADFTKQIARWEELATSDRLVFIDPKLHDDYIPVFNPLEIPDHERNPLDIESLVMGLVDCFHTIGSGSLSEAMQNALAAVLTVLCYKDGSTLKDLLDILGSENTGKTAEWMAFAKTIPLNEFYRGFLATDFFSKSVSETKQALRSRIVRFFGSNTVFSAMVNGKSSFNLERLIAEKKIIIFRISKADVNEAGAQTIGKFIVSRIKTAAFKQGKMDKFERPKIYFYIDEFHNYVSSSLLTILKEQRQYGLNLTLAQQVLGADMDPQTKRIVLSNTKVKITGENEPSTLKTIADANNCDLSELTGLEKINTQKKRFFHIKSSIPGIVTEIPDFLVNEKNGVSDAVWERVRQTQISRYYRKLSDIPFATDEIYIPPISQQGESGRNPNKGPTRALPPVSPDTLNFK